MGKMRDMMKALKEFRKLKKLSKDNSNYDLIAEKVIGMVDVLLKARPKDKMLKMYADGIKQAVKDRNEEQYEMYLKMFRNQLIMGK